MTRLTVTGLAILLSCCARDERPDNSWYVESALSFYDPYDKSFTVEKWIRLPRNISIAHESFKVFGYGNIFSEKDWYESPCWIPGLERPVRNKTCKEIVDSLIAHYPAAEAAPEYYKSFWQRRKKEKNDTVVLEILKELRAGLFEGMGFVTDHQFVNDTIVRLLRIRNEPPTAESALKNFKYLRDIGLHLSAHNLLYERYDYYEIGWDREELERSLMKDTVKCCPWPVVEDDTK